MKDISNIDDLDRTSYRIQFDVRSVSNGQKTSTRKFELGFMMLLTVCPEYVESYRDLGASDRVTDVDAMKRVVVGCQ